MPSASTINPAIRRQFRDDDLPEVAAIFEYGMMLYAKNNPASRQCWAEYVRKSLKVDLADIEGTYMATGGNFWVAALEDNNGESTVIGMAALGQKGNVEEEVRRVSIHPGYHRMGVGRKPMTAMGDDPQLQNLDALGFEHREELGLLHLLRLRERGKLRVHGESQACRNVDEQESAVNCNTNANVELSSF